MPAHLVRAKDCQAVERKLKEAGNTNPMFSRKQAHIARKIEESAATTMTPLSGR
jgi:hypothetical protein